MNRTSETPYEIKDQIYHTVSDFGCARWKALLSYAKALAERSPFLPEDIREKKAESVANKALGALLSREDGRLSRIEYGDEIIIVPERNQGPSFDALYAFEAFSALVSEVAEKDLHPEMCYAGESNLYPYHYIFTSGKEDALYRVIVYGADAFSRIGFLEHVCRKDKRYITLLVVPEVYSWEEFKGIRIPGRYRIALVSRRRGNNRTYRCQLTEILDDSTNANTN